MPTDDPWNIVANPDAEKIILGVDFPAAGRREADFAELMGKIGPAWSGYRFVQTLPPRIALDERPTGDTYIQHWVQDGQWGRSEVAAVIGYCVGGVYAAPIAESVARSQPQPPRVILFDPQLTDARLLVSEMFKNISLAGSVFTDEEAEQARKDTERIAASSAGDLLDLATDIVGLYRDLASIAFKRLGLNDNRRDEIIALFESYMAWLASAASIDPSATWAGATAIISADYVAMAAQGNSSIAAADRIIRRKLPLEVTHADLMRSDGAVRILTEQSGL